MVLVSSGVLCRSIASLIKKRQDFIQCNQLWPGRGQFIWISTDSLTYDMPYHGGNLSSRGSLVSLLITQQNVEEICRNLSELILWSYLGWQSVARGSFLLRELTSLSNHFISIFFYFFFQSFNINFRIYSWTKINRHKYWSRGIGFARKTMPTVNYYFSSDDHSTLISTFIFFLHFFFTTGFSTTHHHFHTHSMRNRKFAELGVGWGRDTDIE